MMSKTSSLIKFFLGFVTALVLSASELAIAQHRGWLHYDPEVVTLRGKITTIVQYGPPGYGESPASDTVEMPIILVLPLPVRVEGRTTGKLNRRTVTNVTYIQLVFHEREFPNYRNFINKEAFLTGKLFEAITGHHFTDVLLEVESVKVISANSGSQGTQRLFSAEPIKPTKNGMPAGWVPRRPEVAQVEGILTKVVKYGAPNYGDPETDKKLDVPILTLRWPATVDLIAENVAYVQLIFPEKIAYEKYVGRGIRVTGTLSEASANDHFTKVVMQVKAVEPVMAKK